MEVRIKLSDDQEYWRILNPRGELLEVKKTLLLAIAWAKSKGYEVPIDIS